MPREGRLYPLALYLCLGFGELRVREQSGRAHHFGGLEWQFALRPHGDGEVPVAALSDLIGKFLQAHADGVGGARKHEHVPFFCRLCRGGVGGCDQGGREHGQKCDQLPGMRQIYDPEARKHVARVWGIPPEDIIIDPLVFPCATGDENYIGGAVETIEAIRLVKENIPFVKTILGVSNISFGLPAAARERALKLVQELRSHDPGPRCRVFVAVSNGAPLNDGTPRLGTRPSCKCSYSSVSAVCSPNKTVRQTHPGDRRH